MGRMIDAATSDDWAAHAETQVLAEALRLAPDLGWTWAMTQAAGAAAGFSAGETELLLPSGPRDLAALHARACKAAAFARLATVDPATLKIRQRIRQGALAWLDAAMASEPATRRWAGFLALPTNAALGVRLAWESADTLWRWAGDRSTDENHYTKRALLAAILTTTLLVRLADGAEAAEAQLDRRIEGVMRFEKLKARLTGAQVGRRAASALGWLRHAALRG